MRRRSGRIASTSIPFARGDTWQSIAQRMGESAGLKPSTLAIMNNYEPTEAPRPGDRIKIVVEG